MTFRRGAAAPGRAVTLIATVLIGALAATIALVVVRQSVAVTRAEATRIEYGRAHAAAVEVQAEFERRLRDDATFYQRSVFPWERPRKCAAPPAEETPVFYDDQHLLSGDFPYVVPPADPRSPEHDGTWPASCGITWDYETLEDHPQRIRAEIDPPTANNPTLTLRVLATVGHTDAGVVTTYQTTPVSRFSVYADHDLDLDQIYRSNSTTPVPVRGDIYSGGDLTLPKRRGVAVDGARLFSEGLISEGQKKVDGTLYVPGGTGANFYDTEVGDIRRLIPDPARGAELVAAASDLVTVGCRPIGAGELRNYTSGKAAGTTSQLCLRSGGSALRANGTEQIFPDKVAAWLVIPDGDQVRVYTADESPGNPDPMPLPPGNCSFLCDLLAFTHTTLPTPGELSSWNFAGSFRVPTSGVIAADADVYLSRCEGYAGNGTTCGTATWPGAEVPGGGTRTSRGFTLVAGTAVRPHDVWISGPLRLADTRDDYRVGVVAFGSIRFPWWGHTRTSDLEVHASLLSLGFTTLPGTQTSARPGIVSYPVVFGGAGAGNGTWDADLRITGSVAAQTYPHRVSGFGSVSVVPDPGLSTTAPPLFPGFGSAATRRLNERLSPMQVCGEPVSCYAKW